MGLRKVLLVTADQWRAECLSVLGHRCVRTPNLDRLAAEGTLFARHYTQAAPCGPARASLLTGLYLMNHRSGRNGTPLDRRHTNLALEVRKAGYNPVLFGYTDTSADPRGLAPDDPSLRSYEGFLPGITPVLWLPETMDVWRADLAAKGYRIPEKPLDIYLPATGSDSAGTHAYGFAPAIYRAEDSDTAYLGHELGRYLRLRRGENWFIHAGFLRPHPPLVAPAPLNALYDPDAIAPPIRQAQRATEAAQHPYLAHRLERLALPGTYTGHAVNMQALSERDHRQLRAIYYALITEVDAHLGAVIDQLKASGEYDETLIVFTTDHGDMLGDHWMYGKEGYFDQAFHIPLIIRDPRRSADKSRGRVVNAFTEAVDVMPTILDWLGCETPIACDGASLVPWLDGETPATWRTEAHWEYDFRDIVNQIPETALGLTSDQCMLNVIRDERYKYVHFAALPPLLFDLENDPFEFTNLAADPAYRETVLSYAQKLLSWRITHADRTLSRMHLTAGGVVERRGPRTR